jgi:NAD(P)-dependent dehydrogenase (short-subunit alcohol dehydrogenase family)
MSDRNGGRGDSSDVAVITGGGSGIGRATVGELAGRGIQVIALDKDGDALHAVRDTFDVYTSVVDVTDESATARELESISRTYGRIDILANVAGIGSTQTVIDTAPEVWDAVFAVNVRGIYNTSRAVLPGMIERCYGVIVNLASIAGMIGLPDRAAYCASKGAVVALTKAMAIDHVAHGIRVNCVCPGTIDTPWVARLVEASEDSRATRQQLIARQPMRRLGTAEEVAKAVAYLATDDSAFVTGAALVIDGGLMAGLTQRRPGSID